MLFAVEVLRDHMVFAVEILKRVGRSGLAAEIQCRCGHSRLAAGFCERYGHLSSLAAAYPSRAMPHLVSSFVHLGAESTTRAESSPDSSPELLAG